MVMYGCVLVCAREVRIQKALVSARVCGRANGIGRDTAWTTFGWQNRAGTKLGRGVVGSGACTFLLQDLSHPILTMKFHISDIR